MPLTYKTGGSQENVIETGPDVVIGSRAYPTVRLGNQLWMAENLDYKIDGIEIGVEGVPTTPAAWYYNNDEGTYGVNGTKAGLLYNGYSLNLIRSVAPSGWRVPRLSDFQTLDNFVQHDTTSLKSTQIWGPGYEGTNETGFSLIPTGERSSTTLNSPFSMIEYMSELWSGASGGNIDSLKFMMVNPSTTMTIGISYPMTHGLAVRLVKDIPNRKILTFITGGQLGDGHGNELGDGTNLLGYKDAPRVLFYRSRGSLGSPEGEFTDGFGNELGYVTNH